MSLWSETKKKPITHLLEHTARRLQAKHDEAQDDVVRAAYATHIAAMKAEAAARAADGRYSVTLKHIGSPAQPFLKRELDARTAKADHEADKRARKALLEEGVELTNEAVASAKMRDPEWQREFGEIARAWIDAGVAEEGAFATLYALGGPDLLIHAMREVQNYQEVSADQGEG